MTLKEYIEDLEINEEINFNQLVKSYMNNLENKHGFKEAAKFFRKNIRKEKEKYLKFQINNKISFNYGIKVIEIAEKRQIYFSGKLNKHKHQGEEWKEVYTLYNFWRQVYKTVWGFLEKKYPRETLLYAKKRDSEW